MSEAAAPLEKLAVFFKLLNAGQVRYCHWKSNSHLEAALAGKTDLDLLVERRDIGHFREIVLCQGFKPVLPPASSRHPAIEEYLGFDPLTGGQAHLHVHYRLVVGQQYVKNYCLPFEAEILNSARLDEKSGVWIPSPEWELLVLVCRALLKMRTRDLVKAAAGRMPVSPSIQSELKYLLERVDRQKFLSAQDAAAYAIPPGLVQAYLGMWQAGRFSPTALWLLCRQLRQSLRPYQQVSSWQASGAYLARLLASRLPEGQAARKCPASGGVTIALVGADGSGKSTVVTEVQRWLGWKLDVRQFYMGSKEPSFRTNLLRVLLRLAGRVERSWSTRAGRAIRHWLNALHAVALAADRRSRYEAGCRAARQGKVVLFDRFPLPEFYGVMDGPQLDPARDGWLGRLEGRIYQDIRCPDFILGLQVGPEAALARKPDHSPEIVSFKTRAVDSLQNALDSGVFLVDAERPLADVLLQVKQTIWEVL